MDGHVTSRRSLDYIGIVEGTDKTSLENDYLRHYERILGNLIDAPFQLLEIGISEGASLRTWRRFLPAATIIGVDINRNCQRFATDRVVVEIGSQVDPEFLSTLTAKYQPTVIIDDGSHQSAHVFLTFKHLFPALRPSGIYIIEDAHLHYGICAASYHAQGGATPADYLSMIAGRLTSGHTEPGSDEAVRRLVGEIDRIEFIPRAVVIYKRDNDDIRGRLDYLFEAARQGDQPLTWFHLSWVLMSQGDLERAEIAIRRAIRLVPERVAHFPRLADVLARRGQIAEAIETLREGIRRDPADASMQSTLARLEARVTA